MRVDHSNVYNDVSFVCVKACPDPSTSYTNMQQCLTVADPSTGQPTSLGNIINNIIKSVSNPSDNNCVYVIKYIQSCRPITGAFSFSAVSSSLQASHPSVSSLVKCDIA